MSEFNILLATSRPAVQGFFTDMGSAPAEGVVTVVLPLSRHAVARAENLSAANVAVVDAAVDAAEALEVCNELRVRHPNLPISVVFCCPQSATAAPLRAFVSARVGGFLDLSVSAEEALQVLRGVARGQGVVQLQLTERSGTALFDGFAGEDEPTDLSDPDARLLELVARGLTDHEIGREMFLSPHTVKHRIERLRRRVHARNRVQLSVWAAARSDDLGRRTRRSTSPPGAARL